MPEQDPDAAVEARVLAALDALGADYDVVRIDPDHADTATFCAVYGYDEDDSGNCILVRGKGGSAAGAGPAYAACVVTASRRVDVNGAVKRRMGVRKASFADPEDAEARTGMRSGGVTPFGLPADVPVYVDAALLERERVVVGGGSRSLKVVVAPEVFARAAGVVIVDDLAVTGAADPRA